MSSVRRSACLLAVAFGAAAASGAFATACGASDDAEADGATDGGVDPGKPPASAAVTPTNVCKRDEDCAGGAKCKEVGANGKACVVSRSCTGGAGAAKCAGKDCCEARAVPGGRFERFLDEDFPAKVSPFLLDTFEVTAGRFRAWVEATNGELRKNAPAAGAGAHPRIPGSGWRAEWNALLPASRVEIDQMLGPERCQVGSNLDDYGTLTWWTPALDKKVKASNKDAAVLAANAKTALEGKPLNCVPWAVLFAFCAWDGGRLPTDAEWSFAAQGGDEARAFPWGSVPTGELIRIDDNSELSRVPKYAAGEKLLVAALWDPSVGPNEFPKNYVHTFGGKFRTRSDNAAHVAAVGERPLGNGRWGHADLAGGMWEWTLDEGPVRPGACDDCANVDWPRPDARDPDAVKGPPDFEDRWFTGGARSVRGGSWDNSLGLANAQTKTEVSWYTSYPVGRTYRALGGRCARDL